MDGQRFDRWARSFAAAASRRGLIKGLAGTIVAGLTAGVDQAEGAARCTGCGACERCGKDGQCTPRANGTLCGQCGVCAGGQCVVRASRCSACKECNTSTFHCDVLPDDSACGDCGRCRSGQCRPDKDKCAHCSTCKVAGDRSYVCKSRCTHGDRCCPDGSCVAADACCVDADCSECERCVDGACQPNSAREGQDCGGSSCKACDNGQCVAKPENSECSGGLCCGGVCRAGAACCDDDGCPECGKCVNFRCDRTAKNGQTCGTTPSCHVCANGDCVALGDGFACKGVIGTCCAGVCCIGNQTCCAGKCCDGNCVFGCCVGGSSASAAGADLCCPFGPPCGEGNAAQCCDEGDTCCNGTCCPGPCDESGAACCPVLRACEDLCCPEDETCLTGECLCPSGQPRCETAGRCCIVSEVGKTEFCGTDGCCDILTDVPCGHNDVNTYTSDGPCCHHDTETCCSNDDDNHTDHWCCANPAMCFHHGCCPQDKPFNVFGPGANGPEPWCCPTADTTHVDFPTECTQTPAEGRRN